MKMNMELRCTHTHTLQASAVVLLCLTAKHLFHQIDHDSGVSTTTISAIPTISNKVVSTSCRWSNWSGSSSHGLKRVSMFKMLENTRCDVYRALGYLPYLANQCIETIVISNIQPVLLTYKDQHLASEVETHPNADPETACLGSHTFAFGGMSLDPP